MSAHTLLVFLKEPRPGRAKTRLIPALGEEDAAAVYRELARLELDATRPQAGEYRRLLCYTPDGAGAEMERWFPGEAYRPQGEGDLGKRMARAFEAAFQAGAERVVVIGSDVPWVSRAHVLQGLDGLARHDLVIGPAADGGYYLLATRQPRPELFRDIPWSTPQVLDRTLERGRALGLSVHSLETLSDVDTLEDLRRDWPRLAPLLEDPGLATRVGTAIRRSEA